MLIPKKVLQNYAFNLINKKQVILHGPKGSGKRQLAKKFKIILYITLKKCEVLFLNAKAYEIISNLY